MLSRSTSTTNKTPPTMPRHSDEATPPTRSKSIRLRSIFKPLRSSADNDTPPVPLVLTLSPSPSVADLATAPPSRSTSLRLHTPRSLHTPPLRKLASVSSSGGLRSTGQEDVLKKRRQALLEASQSMGLIEGLQGHEAFARNLLGKHEQFGRFGVGEGEEEGDGGEEVDGGSGEGSAMPVDCYVPSTSVAGGSVPASPFQGEFPTAVGVLKGILMRADSFFPSISRQSTQKSFASNIFDDTDALSTGIRKYVESKIAESLHKHDLPAPDSRAATSFNTFLNTVGTSNGINLTVKLRLPDTTAPSPSSQSTGALFTTNTNTNSTTTILDAPKRIGPLPLAPTPNTLTLQLGICAIYILTLLFAAFLSHLTLLVTLWRVTAVLAGYAVFSRLCGWDSDSSGFEGDLLLAPAVWVCEILGRKAREVVQLYTEWKVGVQARALREVLGEAEVRLESRGQAVSRGV